jgi:hypothetical protein
MPQARKGARGKDGTSCPRLSTQKPRSANCASACPDSANCPHAWSFRVSYLRAVTIPKLDEADHYRCNVDRAPGGRRANTFDAAANVRGLSCQRGFPWSPPSADPDNTGTAPLSHSNSGRCRKGMGSLDQRRMGQGAEQTWTELRGPLRGNRLGLWSA